MKKNSLLFLAMMGVFTLTWTGCTDSVDYTPAEEVQGQGVYFPKSVKTSYTLTDVKGEIALNVYRTKTAGNFDAPLTVSINEGGDKLFKVPATVPFADGQDSTSVSISFDKLVRGTNYELSLSFADGTAYGNSSVKLNVIYPKAKEYKWEVVSRDAVYIDNLFSMFSVPEISFAKELGKKIVVEKAEGLNMFRFQSPYDNSYFDLLFGESIFPADYEFPYIVLDGETYKEYNLWYIKSTNLGFQMVNEVGPKFDPAWNTFGSIAGNLSTSEGPIPPTSKEYPLGTYDRKSKSFDFGVTYHNLGNHGLVINRAPFKLFLDPKLMESDFDRDFTWVNVDDSEGELTSEIAGGEVKLVTLQQAKEDATFYRIPQMYSANEHLYFNIKDNKVTLPKKQPTGLETFGNPVYMEGTPGKSSFDPETMELKLGVTLYLADENGEKKADLKSGVETFLWGRTELDKLALGKTINDYVGTWDVTFTDGQQKASLPITLTKAGNDSLIVTGLSGAANYDDSFTIKYEVATGLLTFVPKETAVIQEGISTYISLFDPIEGLVDFDGKEKLIGGFISDNTLKFLNNPENAYKWSNTAFLITDGDQLALLTDYWNELEFTAVESETTVRPLSIASTFTPIVPFKSNEFKPSLYKGESNKKQLNGANFLKLVSAEKSDLFY